MQQLQGGQAGLVEEQDLGSAQHGGVDEVVGCCLSGGAELACA